MEMRMIRRLNLNGLASGYRFHYEFAEVAVISPAFLHQLLTGKRSIGEKIARKIEANLGLNEFSLDEKNKYVISPIVKEQKCTTLEDANNGLDDFKSKWGEMDYDQLKKYFGINDFNLLALLHEVFFYSSAESKADCIVRIKIIVEGLEMRLMSEKSKKNQDEKES